MILEPVREPELDFSGESYGSLYPNLHRYPATMLPQVGIWLLEKWGIQGGRFLDPYCGSGSSFASALAVGDFEMYGYDLNPLAVLISRAKFTLLDLATIEQYYDALRDRLLGEKPTEITIPPIVNIDYWYAKEVQQDLAFIKQVLTETVVSPYADLFTLPFCETVRDCSYTRSNEFKLFRIPEKQIPTFQPDAIAYYLRRLSQTIEVYRLIYHPKLAQKRLDLYLENKAFQNGVSEVDVVLTSPPYGDSRTTVAYGQFSNFANEWLDVPQARQIDNQLMGGKTATEPFTDGIIGAQITQIAEEHPKRAKEVSAFYMDLQKSIQKVAHAVKQGGMVFYVLGNRTVKGVQLRTDLFTAEQFTQNGFEHLTTYERKIANKVMPSANSPSNINGQTAPTMTMEYIAVCRKK